MLAQRRQGATWMQGASARIWQTPRLLRSAMVHRMNMGDAAVARLPCLSALSQSAFEPLGGRQSPSHAGWIKRGKRGVCDGIVALKHRNVERYSPRTLLMVASAPSVGSSLGNLPQIAPIEAKAASSALIKQHGVWLHRPRSLATIASRRARRMARNRWTPGSMAINNQPQTEIANRCVTTGIDPDKSPLYNVDAQSSGANT
jgi:hypothetical protein